MPLFSRERAISTFTCSTRLHDGVMLVDAGHGLPSAGRSVVCVVSPPRAFIAGFLLSLNCKNLIFSVLLVLYKRLSGQLHEKWILRSFWRRTSGSAHRTDNRPQ